MTVLYVASDRRGGGKTALCAALAAELMRMGKSVAVMKPVPEDGNPGADSHVAIYRRLLGESAAIDSLPHGGGTGELLREIEGAARRALKERDILLIEGASAIVDEDAARLVEATGARVLMIAKYDFEFNVSRLARWKALFDERLLGFVINGLTRYRRRHVDTVLLPEMSSTGLASLGVIPEDRLLLAPTVSQIATELEGRYVPDEEFGDRLVEHFMVGVMGLDPGELYFGLRENKAVIIRGDRPDIQMAALQTPTACMLLTKGIEPIEYVVYEAEQEQVPVIVVESDTLGTMGALDAVSSRARFDHPSKLERFGELLEEHVDLAAIYAGLGLAA